MTILLADIGGTYARLAVLEQDAFLYCEKFDAASYARFEDALAAYVARHELSAPFSLYIATAAQPEEAGSLSSCWRFLNQNSWLIDPEALRKAGFAVQNIVNDFAATAHSLPALPQESVQALNEAGIKKTGDRANLPRVIIGPGTGLGMAYSFPLKAANEASQACLVQETFGGHMLLPAATEEQAAVLAAVKALKPDATSVVPEDVVSGRGLPFLYRAVCRIRGEDPAAGNNMAAEIFAGQSPAHRDAQRLFFEFLGVFAHLAVTTIHGYGGLYLEGGIVKTLYVDNRFDFDSFARFFILNPVPVVRQALEETPVYLLRDPYTALYGLKEIIKEDEHKA